MEQLTALYTEALEAINEAQDRLELVQEWAEATNQKGALLVLDDTMRATTKAYHKLSDAERQHAEMAQTLEDIQAADSKAFLELLGDYCQSEHCKGKGRSLKQVTLDIIAPQEKRDDYKELRLSNYIYRLIKDDIHAFMNGKPSLAATYTE